MNKPSFKKFLPGLVSVIIIAGMAVQSFATNIDLTAFVNMDKYMAKYYELDWRIKDIDGRLDRLYKFTCKNVKTFGGTHYNPRGRGTPFYMGSYNSNYNSDNYFYAFLDDPKAVRVNRRYLLIYNGTGSPGGTYRLHTNTMKREFPASMCKWNKGIELLPTTKISFSIDDRVTGGNTNTMTATVTMGPFKKVPKFTGGQSQATGYLVELPVQLFNSTWNWTNVMQYAYGSETQPTSWTNLGSDVQLYSYGYYYAGYSNSQYPPITREDYENGDIAIDKKSFGHTFLYFNAGTVADLSSRTNVWLRMYYSYSATSSWGSYAGLDQLNLTSWNNNK